MQEKPSNPPVCKRGNKGFRNSLFDFRIVLDGPSILLCLRKIAPMLMQMRFSRPWMDYRNFGNDNTGGDARKFFKVQNAFFSLAVCAKSGSAEVTACGNTTVVAIERINHREQPAICKKLRSSFMLSDVESYQQYTPFKDSHIFRFCSTCAREKDLFI